MRSQQRRAGVTASARERLFRFVALGRRGAAQRGKAMTYRVFLRLIVAGAIGFGIGLAAQAKGIAPAHAYVAPVKIEAQAR